MSIKREAKFTMVFRSWLKSQTFFGCSVAFELKQTTTHSIPFTDVQPHQLTALRAAKHGGFTYKISDESRGTKPFDMFYLYQVPAFIVIRYPKFFCIIDVDKFIEESMRSERKSLVDVRAKEISTTCVELS